MTNDPNFVLPEWLVLLVGQLVIEKANAEAALRHALAQQPAVTTTASTRVKRKTAS